MSPEEVDDALEGGRKTGSLKHEEDHEGVDDVMRQMMDDLGMSMKMLKNSSYFSGDEERFAFSRALSRLSEMGSQEVCISPAHYTFFQALSRHFRESIGLT